MDEKKQDKQINYGEPVPYVVYESSQVRAERTNKRLIVALITAIALIFVSNMMWLYAWFSYDYTSTSSVTIDGKDGVANYIGNDGNIDNGKDNDKENTNTQEKERQNKRSEAAKVREYTNSQVSAAIDEYVHSERDRRLLKRRFIDGICYEPLAEEFNLTPRQAQRIVYKYESCIFRG